MLNLTYPEKKFPLKMNESELSPEKELFERIGNDDKFAFTLIFTKYYRDLVHFSIRFTRNSDASEELVQEIFLKIWEDRRSIVLHTSVKSYLLKAVQNKSIDWLRHMRIANKYSFTLLDNPTLSDNETETYVLHSDLETNLLRAMNKIPSEYSEVFRMSRLESFSYSEIAKQLNVSVRTIEVRMARALSLLRKELIDFLVLVVAVLHLF